MDSFFFYLTAPPGYDRLGVVKIGGSQDYDYLVENLLKAGR